MVSTFGSLAASPLPRAMLLMAAKVHTRRCGQADRSLPRQRRVTKRRRRCPERSIGTRNVKPEPLVPRSPETKPLTRSGVPGANSPLSALQRARKGGSTPRVNAIQHSEWWLVPPYGVPVNAVRILWLFHRGLRGETTTEFGHRAGNRTVGRKRSARTGGLATFREQYRYSSRHST
jgi:hypothetical protein